MVGTDGLEQLGLLCSVHINIYFLNSPHVSQLPRVSSRLFGEYYKDKEREKRKVMNNRKIGKEFCSSDLVTKTKQFQSKFCFKTDLSLGRNWKYYWYDYFFFV